jgi:hypothetical protein
MQFPVLVGAASVQVEEKLVFLNGTSAFGLAKAKGAGAKQVAEKLMLCIRARL